MHDRGQAEDAMTLAGAAAVERVRGVRTRYDGGDQMDRLQNAFAQVSG
jgi:hypothetical protein